MYNNSHVSTAQAQAVSQALSQADGVSTGGQTQQSQPVEFNHAINYVNKIKVGLLATEERLFNEICAQTKNDEDSETYIKLSKCYF